MKPTTPDTEVSPPVQADKLVKNISAVDADGNGLRFRYVECMFPFQTQTARIEENLQCQTNIKLLVVSPLGEGPWRGKRSRTRLTTEAPD